MSSYVTGVLRTHKETGTAMSDGGAEAWCGELVPSDSTQGGGSTADSAAEWTQLPRCLNYDEWMLGKISEGRQDRDVQLQTARRTRSRLRAPRRPPP